MEKYRINDYNSDPPNTLILWFYAIKINISVERFGSVMCNRIIFHVIQIMLSRPQPWSRWSLCKFCGLHRCYERCMIQSPRIYVTTWLANNSCKGAWSDCFNFVQNFWDFGIRKLVFFSLPLMNFTAENVPFGRYYLKCD